MSGAHETPTETTTAELCTALEPGLAERFGGSPRIKRCDSRPSAFETSYRLLDLDVHLDDGRVLAMVFKDVATDALSAAASRAKPAFVLDPLREIATYRDVLEQYGDGTPACYATVSEPDRVRYWLFLERVSGAHLWEIGELDVWQSAARWLARFHARCEGLAATPAAGPGTPLLHDAALHRTWAERALRFAAGARRIRPDRVKRLERLVERYDSVIERLEELPRTFVHGEFFASNVLVARPSGAAAAPPVRVCPIDWEMSGVGTGASDLAALTAGWAHDTREAIALSYFEEQRSSGWYRAPAELLEALDLCHLLLAVQMLGWAEDWSPPRKHRQDWLGEALNQAAKLGILGGSRS